MNKRFENFILLALMILLPACASSRPSPVQIDAPVSPTAVEKVVTLVPEEDQPPGPRATVTLVAVFDEKAIKTASGNLSALLNAPQLELTYQNMERSPNATYYQGALFVDQYGNRYILSPDTLQPVEFTLEQTLQEAPGAVKTVDELRTMAIQLAASQSSKFESLDGQLVYTEGNKSGENYFFRWEMPGTDVGGMPAILQIGLKQDGTLFSYLNSLDFLP